MIKPESRMMNGKRKSKDNLKLPFRKEREGKVLDGSKTKVRNKKQGRRIQKKG
jgi:hypothetical protein